jgi:hypothetical protein
LPERYFNIPEEKKIIAKPNISTGGDFQKVAEVR